MSITIVPAKKIPVQLLSLPSGRIIEKRFEYGDLDDESTPNCNFSNNSAYKVFTALNLLSSQVALHDLEDFSAVEIQRLCLEFLGRDQAYMAEFAVKSSEPVMRGVVADLMGGATVIDCDWDGVDSLTKRIKRVLEVATCAIAQFGEDALIYIF